MTEDDARRLCLKLQNMIDAGRSQLAGDGWSAGPVAPRFLMKTHLPVLPFRNGDKSLCFIVTPTDPSSRVYARTAHYDVVYFSEDVPDDKQSEIYRRDRTFIDRFVAWLRLNES